MAKESGLGMTMSVDDSGGTQRALTNDVTDVKWEMSSDVQDTTGIDKSAHERLLLLADFSITLNGVFNDAATTSSFAVFKDYRTLASSQVGRTTTMVHSGQTLANEVLYDHFDFTRGSDGSLTWESGGGVSDGTVPVWS